MKGAQSNSLADLVLSLIAVFVGILFFPKNMAEARRGGENTATQSMLIDIGTGLVQGSLTTDLAGRANFSGLSINPKVHFPILSTEQFGIFLSASYQHLDLKNSSNRSNQSEALRLSGPGAGIRIQWQKIFVGADYHQLQVESLSVGEVNRRMDDRSLIPQFYAGFMVPMDRFGLGFTYSQGQSRLDDARASNGESIRLETRQFLVNFTWITGFEFANFLFGD